MSSLQKLQHWYSKHCNGSWEHQHGIAIDTLDNPGWTVTIDLNGTELESLQMGSIDEENDEQDWLHCKIDSGKFIGNGDALKLETILELFLTLTAETSFDGNG